MARCPTVLESWQAVMSPSFPEPQLCHAVCSLGLEILLGGLCCLEGPIKHVKRHLAFLNVMACHCLCSGWRRTPAVRTGPPLLAHTWAAWPGLDLSKGVWCLGLTCRSPLQFEALSFLVKRKEERGLPRSFSLSSPWSLELIH